MFDLFGSEVSTPLPALSLEEQNVRQEDLLAWEKELLGVYVSEHPFRAVAAALAPYATHSLSDLTLEMVGQNATVAGLVASIQSRATRDGRKFYIVQLEDLSGAPVILDAQKPDGSWYGGAKRCNSTWDTCFAILFLKKATQRLEVASEDRLRSK